VTCSTSATSRRGTPRSATCSPAAGTSRCSRPRRVPVPVREPIPRCPRRCRRGGTTAATPSCRSCSRAATSGLMEELVAADAPLFGRADAHLRLQPFGGGRRAARRRRRPGVVARGVRHRRRHAPLPAAVGPPPRRGHEPRRPARRPGRAARRRGHRRPPGARARLGGRPGARARRARRGHVRGGPGAHRARAGHDQRSLSTLESLGCSTASPRSARTPRRTKRVRYEVRDPFLRLWLGLVQPHREAFELGSRRGVLTANRDRLAQSQGQCFEAIARDWLGGVTEATVGPWWPTGAAPRCSAPAPTARSTRSTCSPATATGCCGRRTSSAEGVPDRPPGCRPVGSPIAGSRQ
jgi:hypothetical protein